MKETNDIFKTFVSASEEKLVIDFCRVSAMKKAFPKINPVHLKEWVSIKKAGVRVIVTIEKCGRPFGLQALQGLAKATNFESILRCRDLSLSPEAIEWLNSSNKHEVEYHEYADFDVMINGEDLNTLTIREASNGNFSSRFAVRSGDKGQVRYVYTSNLKDLELLFSIADGELYKHGISVHIALNLMEKLSDKSATTKLFELKDAHWRREQKRIANEKIKTHPKQPIVKPIEISSDHIELSMSTYSEDLLGQIKGTVKQHSYDPSTYAWIVKPTLSNIRNLIEKLENDDDWQATDDQLLDLKEFAQRLEDSYPGCTPLTDGA